MREPVSLKPVIILVAPQMGENIGAAARAMFNFGLRDLRLVAPRDGWPSFEAERNAAGALEKMNPVQVFDTLQEAIADLHFVLATTARPRDMVKDVYTPPAAIAAFSAREGQKCGLIFGGERAGLSNDHIALAQGIITIPTNPDFSSLNLGQSVLLVCWEWMRAHNDAQPIRTTHGDSFPATQDKLEEFFKRLEAELDDGKFFKAPDLKPTMIRNIRAMLTRMDMSDQELRTVHGMVSALLNTDKKSRPEN